MTFRSGPLGRGVAALGLLVLLAGLAPGSFGRPGGPASDAPGASAHGWTPPPSILLRQTRSISVGSAPNLSAYDALAGDLYVPDTGNDSVSVVRGLSVVATVPVGTAPSAAVDDAASGLVYVLNTGSSNVTVLNGSSPVATLPVGSGPEYGAYDPVNGFVYVANALSDNVSVINGTTIVGAIATPGAPAYPTVDPRSGLVYVSNYGVSSPGKITILNGTTVAASLNLTSNGPGAFDPANGFVYLAAHYGYLVLNGTTEDAHGSLLYWTYGAVYDPVNGWIYLPGDDDYGYSPTGEVTVLNGTSRLGTVSGGVNALAAAVDPSSGFVYAVSEPSGRVGGTAEIYEGLRHIASIGLGPGAVHPIYDPATGFVCVPANRGTNVTAVLAERAFPVAFEAKGLPNGTVWTVATNGSSYSTSGGTVTVYLANGSHAFAVPAVSGYRVVPNGTILVDGLPLQVLLRFSPFEFDLRFHEVGLPSGTVWNLTIGGRTYSGAGDRLTARLPNGSYAYSVTSSGYTATPSNGTLIVLGTSYRVRIVFS